MKEKVTRITLREALTRKGKTDWKRVDALTDEDLEAAIASDPDAAPTLDAEWFRNATLVLPEPKAAISLRVDQEVLAWFRERGRGWQDADERRACANTPPRMAPSWTRARCVRRRPRRRASRSAPRAPVPSV